MIKKELYSIIFLIPFFCNAQTFIIPERSVPPQAIEINAKRETSFPYLSCDTYRAFCDFVIDETHVPFDPDMVKDGDTIFLSGWDLEFFFSAIHPHIKRHYILVTHHTDAPVPGTFTRYLEEETLAAWFSQNCSIDYHPKFFPIPIGLANRYWPHGNIDILSYEREHRSPRRDVLLYMNFNVWTNRSEREPIWFGFKNKSFCRVASPTRDFRSYLRDLAQSEFVLSPRGNGLDCHRHWEALLMGAIPVIKHSTLDPLFEGLPVLLINDWNEVTEEFLCAAYSRIKSQKIDLEKLFAPYWFEKINTVKEAIKMRYAC